MSYELQVAAEAKKQAEELAARVGLVEEFLGNDLTEFVAKREQEKVVAAEAAEPIDLTPEEKQAILAARLQIKQAIEEKNSPLAATT